MSRCDGLPLALDAFFPFRDGIDAAADAGIRAIVQAGGSTREPQVIAAADEQGIAMVFTRAEAFPALTWLDSSRQADLTP